jgi:hypothetical protein
LELDENMETRKLVEVEGLEDASKKVNIEDGPLTMSRRRSWKLLHKTC